MKHSLLTIIFILVTISSVAQCPQFLNLTTQAEVNNFPIEYPNCTGFNNVLTLNGVDITDLTPLSSIVFLEALIVENTSLTSLAGLENLTEAGLVELINNDQLTDISSINAITNLFFLTIEDNDVLSECSIFVICDFLVNEGVPSIENNASGCNNEEEVILSCLDTFNSITGTVRFDFDNNDCTVTDYNVPSILVEVTNTDNTYTTATNSQGNYILFFLEDGTHTISVVESSLPENFESTPASQTIQFTGQGNQETADFCLIAIEEFNDLKVTILPLQDARPGFTSDYL